MSNNHKNTIIQRLKILQKEQDELIEQLNNLSINTTQEQTQNEQEDPDILNIGDKVYIKNPGRFQERRGTICNIGNQRVTILTKRGKKIIQAPFNVQKEKQT